ncbi:hypothetical protein BKA64DRAFT_187097 [Cadophora sp. MPI-SDFR-AT-0126]|nr:hypothetical protein BKA64DRAFT_187097 [Leotiomycetes sp. MPI-SDFR-AT-0126]
MVSSTRRPSQKLTTRILNCLVAKNSPRSNRKPLQHNFDVLAGYRKQNYLRRNSPLHPAHLPVQQRHACCHCNKAFTRASDMNKHVKYHTRPITCPITGCDYTCGRQKDLSRHQHGVHKDIYGEEEFPVCMRSVGKQG